MAAKKTAKSKATTTTTSPATQVAPPTAEQQKIHRENAEKANEQRQRAAEVTDMPGSRLGGAAGVPPTPEKAKGETRLYEVSPGNKVWLTQDEAESRGFFWLQDPAKAAKSKR